MKIKKQEMAFLFRQLATLINAGLTLTDICNILISTQTNPAIKIFMQNIKNEINTGRPLAAAMLKHHQYVDSLSCSLIYIGEQSGKLDVLLNRIADQKEQSLKLTHEIQRALFYPSIILITSLCITLIMITLVIPRFAEFFTSFHQQLPLPTRMVLSMSQFCRHYFWLIIFPIAVLFYIRHQYCQNLAFKNNLLSHLLKLPGAGTLLQKIFFIRFTQTLAILLSSGITLQDGLTMMKNLNHTFFRKILTLIISRIETGQSLYQALQGSQFFSPFILQMVKVGEESGSLETMLEKISAFYERENQTWLHKFTQILEPLIILILGVLIGGLMIAMYLPIFKLGSIV